MSIPTDFAAANLAILEAYAPLVWLLKQDHPEALDQLTPIVAGSVPPERVSEFFEFAYAYRDLLNDELRGVAADIGNFAWTNGFWGLGVDQRGALMEKVLRGQDLPEGATEPGISAKYVRVEAAEGDEVEVP